MPAGLVRQLPFPNRRRALGAVRQHVADVEGWLTDAEGMLLYELARRAPGRGALVEIGSWKGRSTIWLAAGSRAGHGSPIVAIDPHTGSAEHHGALGAVDTFAEFQTNLMEAGVADLVRPVVATSADAARDFSDPVDLVFIDGAHDYAAVCTDIDTWFEKVVPGGVLAFHDAIADWPDVLRAIHDRLIAAGSVDRVRFVHSIVYARKRARPSRRSSLVGAGVLNAKAVVDRARPGLDAVMRRARRLR